MTRQQTKKGCDIVQLSSRDWLVVMTIVVPIILFVVHGYLRHDRMLTQVKTHQQSIGERLQRVESTLDSRGGF